MSQLIPSQNRIIGCKTHNRFVAEGVEQHKSTKIAPSQLFKKISEGVENEIRTRREEIEKQLKNSIGDPFYSDSGFILYNGDCCEFLGKIQKSSINFDLTVTSPPYNIGKEYEEIQSLEKYINWCGEWINYIFNSTKPNGSFWLNVGYLEVPGKGLCVPIPYLLWDKSPFYLLQEVVWQYGAGVSTKKRLSPRNEKWLFYVKDPNNYPFNLDDIRDPNVKYPNQKKNGKFRCNSLGKNPSDVWEFPKVTTGEKRSSKERTSHPAQFPLAVVERIILASSNQSDVILDPFAGSCSTGIAAVGSGRIFVGFETRKDYCEMSVTRFKDFMKEKKLKLSQTTLF